VVRIIQRCTEPNPDRRYQQVREVLRDLDSEVAPPASRSMQITLPVPARSGWMLAGATLLALLVLAVLLPPVRRFQLHRSPPSATTSAGIPSLAQGKYIAVLPFRVLGDQASLGYIAEGLSESLSARLFQLKDVHVTSPSAADKADDRISPEKIARALGANLLVRGAVQGATQSGQVQKVAVIVRVDDVSTGRPLWSGEVSGVAQDLLTLEDQMSSQLISALELKPSGPELERAGAHPTENMEAYDLYLKGRDALRRAQSAGDIQNAIGFYDAALKKDPSFTLAFTGLADANLAMYSQTKDALWEQKALGAAQQAQQLNNQLAEVHFSLGSVYRVSGKVAESIAELDRALQLAPNSDDGYRRLGSAYLAGGRTSEAIKAYQKAIDLNPYYWANHNALGTAYFTVGDNEKALNAFHQVTEIEPDNSIGYMNIGAVFFRQGRYEECIPYFQKALSLKPQADLYSNMGTAYFFLKRYAEAVTMFEKAVDMNPNGSDLMGNLADAYRWSGHADKAQSTYDKAIALAYKELQVNPRNADILDSLGVYYAKKGDTLQGLQFVHRARAIDPSNIQFIYNEAQVRTLAGQTPEALKALREAFEKGYSPQEARSDPELGRLQGVPEFDRLLKEFPRSSN
jgi:tetratricopeptide (TPR) repeat protein/TolB-like protein